MNPDAGQRLFIARDDLHRTRIGPDPDSPASRPLQPGEARLAIDQFGLTANNITYAAFGETMKYWQFFPAPDPAWACLPVWGFASVAESSVEGVAVGRRVWGYFPAGTHLVVQPSRAGAHRFVDAAAHRQDLAAVYNQYTWCDADPTWLPQTEGLQAVLRPLFTTSFLIDDFLADQGYFGARQLLLSSASSKTAYGTAFCLARRRGTAGLPAVVGLTSAGHVDFTRSLACYDEVCAYDALASLPRLPTLYVDFAGSAALRRRVHEQFGDALVYSSSIGGTHWSELGAGSGLPGPRPVLFFAPSQFKKRSAPPPEGWGQESMRQRVDESWAQFIARAGRVDDPWLRVVAERGAPALLAAYASLLNGQADARTGLMLSLQA